MNANRRCVKVFSWVLTLAMLTVAAPGRAEDPATPSSETPTTPALDPATPPTGGAPPAGTASPVPSAGSPAAYGAAPRSSANTDEKGCFLPSEWFSRAGRNIYSLQRLAGLQIGELGTRDERTAHVLYYATRGGSPFNLPMFGYDNVLGERITFGIAVGGLISRREGIYAEAMARFGYIAPLTSRVAFWGRGGVGSINGPELAWYNLQIDLVLLVGDSLGLTLGAALDMPFEDRQDELRALGAMLGMLLY